MYKYFQSNLNFKTKAVQAKIIIVENKIKLKLSTKKKKKIKNKINKIQMKIFNIIIE